MAPRRSRRLASQEPEIEAPQSDLPLPTPKRNSRRATQQGRARTQLQTRRQTRACSRLSQDTSSEALSKDVSEEELSRPSTSASEAIAHPSVEVDVIGVADAIREEPEREDEGSEAQVEVGEVDLIEVEEIVEVKDHIEGRQFEEQVPPRPFKGLSNGDGPKLRGNVEEEAHTGLEILHEETHQEDSSEEVMDIEEPSRNAPSPALSVLEEVDTVEPDVRMAPPATPVPAWRTYLTSAIGMLSPFGRRTPQPPASLATVERKRTAPDDGDSVPAKRARTTVTPTLIPKDRDHVPKFFSEVHPLATEPRRVIDRGPTSRTPMKSLDLTSHHTRIVKEPQSVPARRERSTIPARRIRRPRQLHERPSSDHPSMPTIKEPPSSLSNVDASLSRNTESLADEPGTPRLHPETPRFLCPSTKRSNAVSSLTPIAEQRETSRLKPASESTPMALYTPSRKPATAQMRRRTVAEVRAQRLANTPSSGMGRRQGPFVWEAANSERERARDALPPNASTSLRTSKTSKKTSADERFAKLEHMRMLERELEKLRKDEDIIEMESHRRKRVKVDSLQYIPHNRPGDAEGTFCVPEWDSDDEMEVEEAVPERINVFKQAQTVSPPKAVMSAPVMQDAARVTPPRRGSVFESARKAPSQSQEKPAPKVFERVTMTPSKFTFPSVSKRMPDDKPSHHYIEAAKNKFATGFEEWRLLQGY